MNAKVEIKIAGCVFKNAAAEVLKYIGKEHMLSVDVCLEAGRYFITQHELKTKVKTDYKIISA